MIAAKLNSSSTASTTSRSYGGYNVPRATGETSIHTGAPAELFHRGHVACNTCSLWLAQAFRQKNASSNHSSAIAGIHAPRQKPTSTPGSNAIQPSSPGCHLSVAPWFRCRSAIKLGRFSPLQLPPGGSTIRECCRSVFPYNGRFARCFPASANRALRPVTGYVISRAGRLALDSQRHYFLRLRKLVRHYPHFQHNRSPVDHHRLLPVCYKSCRPIPETIHRDR